jgi:hypothetical protein
MVRVSSDLLKGIISMEHGKYCFIYDNVGTMIGISRFTVYYFIYICLIWDFDWV